MNRFITATLFACNLWAAQKKPTPPKLSPLDQYIQSASQRKTETNGSPGSLYVSSARLADLGRDFRASQVDDLVTIVISDKASAVSKGTTNTSRASSVKGSVTALAGIKNAKGSLANLLAATNNQNLQGQGQTTRDTSLTTTLSARVTHVLANGDLVVEGVKNVGVNSEHQQVTIRGIVRWSDLDAVNQVSSDRLGDLELKINGKGVVNDSIRRPNFLYRLVLGLLPF